MPEIKKLFVSGIVASAVFVSSCASDRETPFTNCTFDPNPQSTGDDPIYLRQNRLGTNYELTLGENHFLRDRKTGELEWIVNDIPQEMFPQDEIIVFDNHTGRTADILFTKSDTFIRMDITETCNSNLELTPIGEN